MSVYIQLTDKCNMTCEHCCFSCTDKGTFMTQEIFDIALAIAADHGQDVTLGGGEPTLHPKCVEWTAQAAVALVDVSLEQDGPAVLVITNGKKKDAAIKLGKLARAKIIQAELSQDPWHDPIDPKTVDFFERNAWIRNVSKGIKAKGRALLNGLSDREGCCCEALFIAPNGDFYGCGCKTKKLGNILTDDIPAEYWENTGECYAEKELVLA